MKATMLIAAMAALAIMGCGEKSGGNIEEKPPERVATPPKPPYTKDEWRAAFKSAFVENNPKTNYDGITEYTACFQNEEGGKCPVFTFGKRDAFRKIDYLTPAHTELNNIGNIQTHIGTYIAAIECQPPSLLIAPKINRKGGWLFMEKISFMADGEVILERAFEHSLIDRDNDGYWIHEKGTFIATLAERDILSKFAASENRIIRITGQKGYLTLPKDKVENFATDIKTAMDAINAINQSLKSSGGPECESVKL